MEDMKKVEFDAKADFVVQLGGDLYKNLSGVLIEYITNSYDADASFVQINTNHESNAIDIIDDGIGMSLEEVENSFLKIGNRRRKKGSITKKGRPVTGRKGLGKLACFGLFKSFILETVQDKKKSTLKITTGETNEGDFFYEALLSDTPQDTDENNGTIVRLVDYQERIPSNTIIAESLSKRINLMYDSDDGNGFYIKVGDIVVNKAYRDEFVLNREIKFRYEIPQDVTRFTTEANIIKYIRDNKINGVVIAREKTVRIKENKGVVLFARGKLCQEATYLNINPSNNYGYAHLYAEFDVSFIDNEYQDNIGTDRTALKDTETTRKLFEVIELLMKAYARIYDEDEKSAKEAQELELKKEIDYDEILKSINNISDSMLKREIESLLAIKIKSTVAQKQEGIHGFQDFEAMINNIVSFISVSSQQINKDEPKDNLSTSYDFLIDYLRKKYDYTKEDGSALISDIYGKNGLAKLNQLAMSQPDNTQKSLCSSAREMGLSVVAMRNASSHCNDRGCFQKTISIENSKRFLISVDLLIGLDTLFFEKA